MKLPAMRFKGFSWPKNPGSFENGNPAGSQRTYSALCRIFGTGLGRKRRKISGEGVFLGEEALASFQELSALLEQGGSGLLDSARTSGHDGDFGEAGARRRNHSSCSAVFLSGLGRSGQWSGRDGVGNREKSSFPGEDVWAIANRSHQAEVILAVNPQIQWPNFLREGEVVHLP